MHRKQFKAAQATLSTPAQACKDKKLISITPIHDITAQIYTLLQHKKTFNEQIKAIQGYTIQVYAGDSRELAFKTKNELYAYFPLASPEVHYDLPNYTVRAGKFLDKIEAYSMYAAIKKVIPQAIIRPIYFANKPNIFTGRQPIRSKKAENDIAYPSPEINELRQEEQD